MVEPQVIEIGESESGFRFGFKGQKNIFLDFSIFERENRKVGFRTQKNIFFPRFSSSRVKKEFRLRVHPGCFPPYVIHLG